MKNVSRVGLFSVLKTNSNIIINFFPSLINFTLDLKFGPILNLDNQFSLGQVDDKNESAEKLKSNRKFFTVDITEFVANVVNFP